MTWRMDWRGSGLCKDPGSGDALYGRGQRKAARELCNRCPVRLECLAAAMKTRQPYGVWGGLTEPERRKLRRAFPEILDWSMALKEVVAGRTTSERLDALLYPTRQPWQKQVERTA